MMFIEMAGHIGAATNYYVDSRFGENLLLHSTEKCGVTGVLATMSD
jgi:hypothetical protein